MKKFLAVLGLFIILNITGCYTIIWTPEDEFPSSSKTNQEEYYDTYYTPDYYGPYVQYYNYPWWMSINSASVTQEIQKERDKNSETQTGRTSDGGRPSDNPRGINVPVPTANTGSGSTGKSSTTTGTGTNSTNTRDSSRDSGNGRNNDGGRNTDSDRGRK